jgi:hypothetical protein
VTEGNEQAEKHGRKQEDVKLPFILNGILRKVLPVQYHVMKPNYVSRALIPGTL